MQDMLEIVDIYKTYKTKSGDVKAVDGVSFKARKGEVTVVVGPSGSGKTTLLYLLGSLEKPDAGEIQAFGEDICSQRRGPHHLPAGEHRFRLPVLQPDHRPHRPGERHAPHGPGRGVSRGPARAGGEAAGEGGIRHQAAEGQGQQDERRGEAEGGHRPRPGQRPGHHPGRRTHRQPRFRHRAERGGHTGQAGPRGRQVRGHHHPRRGHPRYRRLGLSHEGRQVERTRD